MEFDVGLPPKLIQDSYQFLAWEDTQEKLFLGEVGERVWQEGNVMVIWIEGGGGIALVKVVLFFEVLFDSYSRCS